MEKISALLAICAGNSPIPGEFPAHRPVTRSFGIFFDLRLNKQLSKQSRVWWFETLSRYDVTVKMGLYPLRALLDLLYGYSRRQVCNSFEDRAFADAFYTYGSPPPMNCNDFTQSDIPYWNYIFTTSIYHHRYMSLHMGRRTSRLWTIKFVILACP